MKNILVLCTANSAGSILGEALLARYGAGCVKSYSGGFTSREASINLKQVANVIGAKINSTHLVKTNAC